MSQQFFLVGHAAEVPADRPMSSQRRLATCPQADQHARDDRAVDLPRLCKGKGFNEALQSLIEKHGFPWVLIDPKLDPDGLFLPDAQNLQIGIPVMSVECAGIFDRTIRPYCPSGQ